MDELREFIERIPSGRTVRDAPEPKVQQSKPRETERDQLDEKPLPRKVTPRPEVAISRDYRLPPFY